MADFTLLWTYFAISFVVSVALFISHWALKLRYLKKTDVDNYKVEHTLSLLIIGAYTARWFETISPVLLFVNIFAVLRYCISVSFTIFNKWFLNEWNGGFRFPIIYTSVHMIMKFILSRVWACSSAVVIESVSWGYVLFIAVPIGVATALDVMLSNFSLMYISLTLYTIIKSSVLIWTFLWGVLLKIEAFKLNTFCAVLFIVSGIGLAVASSTDVSPIGVAMVLGASAAGGVRWALVQKLMAVDEQSKNVFVSIYRFAPASALSMLPFALGMDLLPLLRSDFFVDSSDNNLAATLALVVLGGLIAFALITTEVHLVNLTSSLTMGVLGQVKEVIQIVLSMAIFHDHVNLLNAAGIVIAMVAVGYYKRIKSVDRETLRYSTLSQVELELDVFDQDLEDSSEETTGGVFDDFDDDQDIISRR